MILGAHVSSAGQMHKAFGRGALIEAECLQIFTRAPSQWRAVPLSGVANFRAELAAHGNLPLFDLLDHLAQPLGDGNSSTTDSD